MKGIYGYYDNQKEMMVYIGKDSHIHENRRKQGHEIPSTYNNQQINRVIQNNPKRYIYLSLIELDDTFTDNDLNELEMYFIKLFGTYKYDNMEKNVFNFTKGGEGSVGYHHTPNNLKIMSEIKKQQYLGENNPFYNKKHTEQTKQKIRESKQGKNQTLNQQIQRSKSNNTTGYFRVSKEKTNNTKQGFVYCYQYYDKTLNRRIKIRRTNLINLKNEVLKRKLTWKEIKEDNAWKQQQSVLMT